MQVARWGNSLAVRLPAVLVEALELKAGDDIRLRVEDLREIAIARNPNRAALIERLREFRSRLPADIVFDDILFDREEANER